MAMGIFMGGYPPIGHGCFHGGYVPPYTAKTNLIPYDVDDDVVGHDKTMMIAMTW